MDKILYVTDLDGTLMRDDKTISKATIDVLNEKIKQGMLFTFATARSKKSALQIVKDIDLQAPVIVRNGTVLVDPKTQKEIEIAMFSTKELEQLRGYISKVSVSGFVTTYYDGIERKNYLRDRINEGFKDYLNNHTDDNRLCAVATEDLLYDGNVCYFTFIAEKEELEPLYNLVSTSDSWTCVFQKDKYRSEFWLEISPRYATKADAIKKIYKLYDCDKLVVFGDSLNDISMFVIADEAYAVANAMEELKAIATGIIGENNSDGIAEWLKNN